MLKKVTQGMGDYSNFIIMHGDGLARDLEVKG